MKTLKIINKNIFLLLVTLLTMSACSFIEEHEDQDCTPYYKVRFRFDMNILEADAFSSQVGEVDLYVLDADGTLVWHGHEEGEILSKEGYLMELPVDPGKYKLVAWARKRYAEAKDFCLGEADPQHFAHLTMSLEREYDGSASHSTSHIHSLFHGIVDEVELPDEWGTHIVTVPLVKDTNSIRIMLVHLDGSPFEEDDFDFKISDNNADLDSDNTILDTDSIEYRSWAKRLGMAQTSVPSVNPGDARKIAPLSRTQTSVHSLVAEMTTSRLQTCRKPMLTVTRSSDGKKVIEIPIIDYFLMVKGEYRRGWTDDEFLDRQDDYSMTFFMHDDGTWFDAVLNILQWRVVRQNADL